MSGTTEIPSYATRVLSASDCLALAAIVGAAQDEKPVARVNDDSDVVYGTARSIGHTDGSFAGRGDDIRDMYLRVTLTSGLDAFWSVAVLLPEIQAGTFVVDYK